MGTRSLTFVFDDGFDKPICCIYRQFDGYPTGLGAELKAFLKDFTIVNGIGAKDPKHFANGMGCLAAQLVKHLKTAVGNVYLYPTDSTDCGEDYVYTIKQAQGKLLISVTEIHSEKYGGNKTIYDGPINLFDPEKVAGGD